MKSHVEREPVAVWLIALTFAAGLASGAVAADYPLAAAWAPGKAATASAAAVTTIAPSAAPARTAAATASNSATGRSRVARKISLPRPRPRPGGTGDDGVFSSVAIALGNLPAADRLQPSEREMRLHETGNCRVDGCPARQRRLAAAMKAASGLGFSAQIRTINETVNALVSYLPDRVNYHQRDHWATPHQTLARGAGDCEDFAILKMASLRTLGIPVASMSIVVLRDDDRDLYHAVLAIKTDRGFFILDNLRDRVLMDSDLPHYTPLYSIVAGRGYIHGRRIDDPRPATVATALDDVSPGEGPAVAWKTEAEQPRSSIPR